MLIRFQVENYRSIRDVQELSLIAGSSKEMAESLMTLDSSKYKVLRVAAIYGANGSGKTNLLAALRFAVNAVKNSHRAWEPEAPIKRPSFKFDEARTKSSMFELEFLVNSTRFVYGFRFNDQQMLQEWLHAYPQGKQQTWFDRDEERAENRFRFSRLLLGENRAIEALTRKNSLFLSAAAQNGHEMLLPIYKWIANAFVFLIGESRPNRDSTELCRDETHRDMLLRMLTAADLGVVGIRVEDADMPEEGKRFSEFLKEMLKPLPGDVPKFDKITRIFVSHKGKEGPVELEMSEESAGTAAFFSLLGSAIRAIESGAVFIVDELDASLHPLLSLELVRLFNDPERNKSGAQLIFNTHDTNLLRNNVLRRDQIWFTEKASDGATHLYPLSDFKTRSGENLESGYLQGRFGAIPFIGGTEFAKITS